MSAELTATGIAVIGGGFYGTAIAAYLARRGTHQVTLKERESALMTRASYKNQARIHNGYHYPRSFTTAFRSRVNFPRFIQRWPQTVSKDVTTLYAIARQNSKVTARQFERFCRDIGAVIRPAGRALSALFEPRLVEDAFLVDESVFDSRILADAVRSELLESGVQILTDTRVESLDPSPGGLIDLSCVTKTGASSAIRCQYVFNCTYSALNQFGGGFPGTTTGLKHEITQLALVQAPPELAGLGITLMDGPFFSLLPFPDRGLHSLSHVRYTPHEYWMDQRGIDPYDKLRAHHLASRFDRMIRDAGRYLPAILRAKHVDSLYEVKTVLAKNEGDDGRPILFERHAQLPGCYSVLGGKIDNIFDIFEKLDAETLPQRGLTEAVHGQ